LRPPLLEEMLSIHRNCLAEQYGDVDLVGLEILKLNGVASLAPTPIELTFRLVLGQEILLAEVFFTGKTKTKQIA
jgi:hypothetical protein